MNTEKDLAIFAKLAQRRIELGMSQSELARRMCEVGYGYSQMTVSRTEKGERTPGIGEVMDLADIVGMSFTALVNVGRGWRPWHDAKEGQVWILTVGSNEVATIYQADRFRDHGGFWSVEEIEYARLIWSPSA